MRHAASQTARNQISNPAGNRPGAWGCSRPARRLVCRVITRLDAAKQQPRDVVAKAAGGDASSEAVPLPEPTPGQPLPDPSLLDRFIDQGVKAPARWYQSALQTNPLLTKALTSFVGFVIGDLIAQRVAHPQFVDLLRCLRLGAYGLLVDGPVGATWYDLLEKYVFPKEPVSTKAVLAKTALDQLVYATIMTGVYFALIKTMEGHPEAIAATIQAKFVPTLAANYMIWPLAHLINFRFVKSEYRILYNNVVCIAWLTLLSFMTHSRLDLMGMMAHLVSGGSSSH